MATLNAFRWLFSKSAALPLRQAWWQDVLLWLVVGLVLAWQLPLWIPQAPQAILLRFKDSSELSAGSPVRLMGTEVGWVHAVRFKKHHVQVKLRFYRDAPPVPPGSAFTIEFTGIAGAKCVEITPPDELLTTRPSSGSSPLNAHFNGPRDPNHYVVVEPIRMADVQQGGLLQVEAMREGAENTARFLDPDGNPTEYNLEANRRLLRSVDASLGQGVNILTGARQVIHHAEAGLHNTAQDLTLTLQDYDRSLDALNTGIITNAPQTLRRQVGQVRQVQQSLQAVKQNPLVTKPNWVVMPEALNPLRQTASALPEITQRLKAVQGSLTNVRQALPGMPGRLRQAADTMAQTRQQLQQWEKAHPLPPSQP